MKKIFVAVVMSVLFVAQTALAMTFQPPVEIGSIFITPSDGIIIKGSSYNSAKPFKKFQNETTYQSGVARWGDETTGLYYIFEKYPPNFGGKDKNFPINIMVHNSIYRINNDGNVTLYLLRSEGSMAGTTNYVLLGRRADGVFVKYFDMNEINVTYFGLQKDIYGTTWGRSSPWYKNCRCQGDTIIIDYERSHGRSGYVKEGEFRFKWDEAAQWFGVEQIIY